MKRILSLLPPKTLFLRVHRNSQRLNPSKPCCYDARVSLNPLALTPWRQEIAAYSDS
jgi:hypothetical protein